MKPIVGRQYRGRYTKTLYTVVYADEKATNPIVMRTSLGNLIVETTANFEADYVLVPTTRDITRWGVVRSDGNVVCTYEDEPAARAAAKRYDYPYVVKLTGSYEV